MHAVTVARLRRLAKSAAASAKIEAAMVETQRPSRDPFSRPNVRPHKAACEPACGLTANSGQKATRE
ncbi:hypothetical protein XH88_06565 [Bradyrhizobium sp. CCBAU 51627]|nr:hypothetical protein [Bradyrhizobium sp. CCBAU 51627]